jgi:2,3-bisphosphoglycerate-independent phosphoglycerate mutase
VCAPPHDYPNEPWKGLLVEAESAGLPKDGDRMTGRRRPTAQRPIVRVRNCCRRIPSTRVAHTRPTASAWGGAIGRREDLAAALSAVEAGSRYLAVDLIAASVDTRSRLVKVPVPPDWPTLTIGKAEAALEALRHQDFVFLHLEAATMPEHDGDLS